MVNCYLCGEIVMRKFTEYPYNLEHNDSYKQIKNICKIAICNIFRQLAITMSKKSYHVSSVRIFFVHRGIIIVLLILII